MAGAGISLSTGPMAGTTGKSHRGSAGSPNPRPGRATGKFPPSRPPGTPIHPEVRIRIVSARRDGCGKLVGRELGADDCIPKPFSPKELVARVRAVLRRAETAAAGPEVLRVGDEVELDLPRMEARISGRRVDLTPTEFQLLAAMAREPGRVFTRAQLLDAVHGVAFESYERDIDAHVKNIRRKLEPDSGAPRYLQTAYGVGYTFAPWRS